MLAGRQAGKQAGSQAARQASRPAARQPGESIRAHGGANTRRRSTGSTKAYESSEDSAAAPPSKAKAGAEAQAIFAAAPEDAVACARRPRDREGRRSGRRRRPRPRRLPAAPRGATTNERVLHCELHLAAPAAIWQGPDVRIALRSLAAGQRCHLSRVRRSRGGRSARGSFSPRRGRSWSIGRSRGGRSARRRFSPRRVRRNRGGRSARRSFSPRRSIGCSRGCDWLRRRRFASSLVSRLPPPPAAPADAWHEDAIFGASDAGPEARLLARDVDAESSSRMKA